MLAPATALAPTPPAPSSATTVSCWSNPACPAVAVTVTLDNVDGAVAVQISESPGWALARFTSVQFSPASLTVAVWPALPSLLTIASSTSPATDVENAGVTTLVLPVCDTWLSTVKPPTGAATVTATGVAVAISPLLSVTWALN